MDDSGVAWQVWEVIPTTAERRSAGERRFGARQKSERRLREQFRVHLGDGVEQGWLVFECAAEKRRLHPIPGGWSERPDHELADLCRRATGTSRTTPRLIE